jgi:hypothetical protein
MRWLPSTVILLVVILLFVMSVIMGVSYWRGAAERSGTLLVNYQNLWWNRRPIISVILALWLLTFTFPTGYFLLHFALHQVDPAEMLGRILIASRVDHPIIGSFLSVFGAVSCMGVGIRVGLAKLSSSNLILLPWCARHYGIVLMLMFCTAIMVRLL